MAKAPSISASEALGLFEDAVALYPEASDRALELLGDAVKNSKWALHQTVVLAKETLADVDLPKRERGQKLLFFAEGIHSRKDGYTEYLGAFYRAEAYALLGRDERTIEMLEWILTAKMSNLPQGRMLKTRACDSLGRIYKSLGEPKPVLDLEEVYR